MKMLPLVARWLILLFVAGSIQLAAGQHPAFSQRQTERSAMVEQGIAAYPYEPVRDPRVLRAMRRVPRHVFVPEAYQAEAYQNHPLPIGHGQTISQPYMVAYMTEALELKKDHKVLEIGTGSGYQAAVLAELCRQLYSVEIIEPLGVQAAHLLDTLGYGNISLRIGDGYKGWPEHAPFDRIIVTCAPEDLPRILVDQLAPGGRLVIPVGPAQGKQHIVFMEKDMKGRLKKRKGPPVRFVPMTGGQRQSP